MAKKNAYQLPVRTKEELDEIEKKLVKERYNIEKSAPLSEQKALKIVLYVTHGLSLEEIAAMDQMPSLFRLGLMLFEKKVPLNEDPEVMMKLRQGYRVAMKTRAAVTADEIVKIADGAVDTSSANAASVAVKARQWLLERSVPDMFAQATRDISDKDDPADEYEKALALLDEKRSGSKQLEQPRDKATQTDD